MGGAFGRRGPPTGPPYHAAEKLVNARRIEPTGRTRGCEGSRPRRLRLPPLRRPFEIAPKPALAGGVLEAFGPPGGDFALRHDGGQFVVEGLWHDDLHLSGVTPVQLAMLTHGVILPASTTSRPCISGRVLGDITS